MDNYISQIIYFIDKIQRYFNIGKYGLLVYIALFVIIFFIVIDINSNITKLRREIDSLKSEILKTKEE